ncbi:uncharacterized protein LOC130081180 [Rhinichthys klamathensis goyatoka]|uniref:uncharacterized protein LOC130081180 n=1 Tax=Rhinichthys klamathensis goyatoka TaxID=3034132 RepID=UPI0024B61025|nr:uncharacterized protein LOC130081180 [Rhinichthys klamathensis goyatoka]
MHNLTAWYQLKIDPGDTIGSMYTLHENNNNGTDPKLCYYVKHLEPATYRCTHTETHNDTHIRFKELMYDLTSYTPNEPKPKAFVWTNRKEGTYCVGECTHSIDNFTNPHNCSWTVKYCFNLTTCGYTKPKICPELHPIPPGGLIRGNINKTLLHDVNLVMTHVNYNISNILSAYTKHCNINDESYAWLQSRIDDLISDYKDRLAVQIPPSRSKRDLLSSIAGLFGSINSAANTYKITKQSQFSTWLTDQMATGFQHLTNSNDNIIKAVRSEAQALLTISHTLFNQTRTIERDLACRSYAQDLFTATRQEIFDLRLHQTPRHVLNDLIEVLDLHRWFSSEKMKNVKYSELLSTIMMYTGNECIGCIGFFATFPLIHPDQVYPNSTTIRSIGMVVKDQVIKWDHLTGYMTLKGTETLFTSRTCCHETHNYVVCTCNTLQPFSSNDSKLINVESLHGHSNAVQVSHTQWCIISEMNSFTYGGLTCPANHSFCLEVTEDFSMGQIDILGRMPKDAEVSPWWDDTFYEHGTQALVDTMDLVQNIVLQTEYHLSQAQVETNLARKTAQILSSSSTRSAQTAYTWWDWVLRGCAVGSALIFSFTLFQCCYFRHLIRSVKASTNTILTLSPLKLPTLQRLK